MLTMAQKAGSPNFGKMKFTGPAKARKLIISCMNADNMKLWEKEIVPE
jgi:hypothetical protein